MREAQEGAAGLSWISLRIKFPGKCVECGEPLAIGEPGMWKKGAGIKHERCGAAAESGDVRAGGGGGGAAAAELRCLVCGKPAGCPACEFSDSCDTAAVSQLCMCRACLEDKDTYALYKAASSRKFPLLAPEGLAARRGAGAAGGRRGTEAPAGARAPRPVGADSGPARRGAGAEAPRGARERPAVGKERGGGAAKKGDGGSGGLRESEQGDGGSGGLRESEQGDGGSGGLRESEQGDGRKKKGEQSKLVPEQGGSGEQGKGDGPKSRRGKAAAKRGQTRLLQQRL